MVRCSPEQLSSYDRSFLSIKSSAAHKRSSKLTSYFITIAADVCCNRKVHHCVRRFRTFLKEMKHLGRSVQRIKGETFPTFSSQV
ncbi:MAG: hypothetical protein ACTS80_02005 [Candidatus Hodgkinia cicadicola]